MSRAGELGMRFRPCEDYPDQVELVWGGAVIGVTTWRWLKTGDVADSPQDGAATVE